MESFFNVSNRDLGKWRLYNAANINKE
jgi:hypothetical protein